MKAETVHFPLKKMNAWVTSITRDSYVVGGQALARSLFSANSRYTLLVLVTPQLSNAAKEMLATEPNIVVLSVEPYKLPDGIKVNYAFERFAEAWNKLRCWEIIGYDKLCWLDADMCVLQNMDEIFDALPADKNFAASHACICNPNKVATYPSWWTPENCHYTSHLKPNSKRYFNAGMLLFRPSKSTLAEMEEYLKQHANIESYIFAEQDFLNEFFHDWLELSFVYNALKTLVVAHSDVWNITKIKNIHYIMEKPWEAHPSVCKNENDPYDDINRMWWLVFHRLNTPNVIEPWK